MNEPTPTEATPPIFAQPWAIRLGFALLSGLTLLIGFAFFDNGRRRQLETMSETTSVGDTSYFALPPTATLPLVAATLHEQPLTVRSAERLTIRDTHVMRVARVAGSSLTIYQLSPKSFPDERKLLEPDLKSYLLKTGSEEYVRADLPGGPK